MTNLITGPTIGAPASALEPSSIQNLPQSGVSPGHLGRNGMTPQDFVSGLRSRASITSHFPELLPEIGHTLTDFKRRFSNTTIVGDRERFRRHVPVSEPLAKSLRVAKEPIFPILQEFPTTLHFILLQATLLRVDE